MRRIGIITTYLNINFGSILQSYALQQVLNKLGIYCENIKYTYGVDASEFDKKCQRGREDRFEVFRNFKKNYIIESRGLKNFRALQSLDYDAYVCGSDQIWAPNLFNPVHFLGFVSKGKKIAYAPSIGLDSIPSSLNDRVKDLLSTFQYISVREQKGVNILKEITGINFPLVLDPTCLLDIEDWLYLINDNSKTLIYNKSKYAFAYFLGKINNIAEITDYCKQHNLKLLSSYSGMGPVQWLSTIFNADIIFTDSFHGLIFSALFNKKFKIYLRFRSDDPICQNSRIFNFLYLFDLYDNLGKNAEDIHLPNILITKQPIYFSSINYLRKAFSE